MANYYTQFSEVIPNLTEEEKAWLERALQDTDLLSDNEELEWENAFGDIFEHGVQFEHQFIENPNSSYGNYLWVHASEGCVEELIALVQAFLARFRPTESWFMSWAATCSKPRVGEFGGGWAVVTADNVESGTTWDGKAHSIIEEQKVLEWLRGNGFSLLAQVVEKSGGAPADDGMDVIDMIADVLVDEGFTIITNQHYADISTRGS